jgi:hypothetical protein
MTDCSGNITWNGTKQMFSRLHEPVCETDQKYSLPSSKRRDQEHRFLLGIGKAYCN